LWFPYRILRRPQGSAALETKAGESQACDGGISGNSCEIAQQEVNVFFGRSVSYGAAASQTDRGDRA
jgi:hypothetical protein